MNFLFLTFSSLSLLRKLHYISTFPFSPSWESGKVRKSRPKSQTNHQRGESTMTTSPGEHCHRYELEECFTCRFWTGERGHRQVCSEEEYQFKLEESRKNWEHRTYHNPTKQFAKPTEQSSKYRCPRDQEVICEAHRLKPERCLTCLVWELEQFQKMKPFTTRKCNL